MNNVLIMSDSHGIREMITMIKERHNPTVTIHCGDSELSEDAYELAGAVKVAGNCDMDNRYPNEALHVIDGWNFFITHGHLNQVKSSLLPITYRANEVNADVICFGHTHIGGTEKIDGKVYINPGSIRLPKGNYGKTYAVVTFPDYGELDVTFYSLTGEKVDALSNHFAFI